MGTVTNSLIQNYWKVTNSLIQNNVKVTNNLIQNYGNRHQQPDPK
jgi:hypothetical protein